jgi:hypothetical protein
LVKTLKLLNILFEVASDLTRLAYAGLATFMRILGPQGLALVLGLGALLTVLAVLGARRFLREGEPS